MESRIINLYNCAIKNKHDVIILGAWGCGAFKESDDDVLIISNIIKKLSKRYQNNIETICAVIGRKNYEQFNKL